MQWDPAAGAACAVAGGVLGLLVPRIIAAVPEPEPDPEEKAGDFPDKIPYADLARRPRLGPWCAVACAVAGALMGVALGWSWALGWLVFLLPVGAALAVIDLSTWYLPTRIIAPSYAVVAVLVCVAAGVLQNVHVVVYAAVGFLGLGAYYGLMWLISPRIMAFGDVRLGGLLGLALGPFGLVTVLASVFLAAVVGAVAIVPMRLSGHSIARRMPFGPFLLIGAVLAVVVGQVLVTG
ncbi:MAG: prepilin peptidase [Nocardioidaceae bacterium]|nr:prepilin peptidase [Nocardioidaceae bacterium]MCL2612248.1 prepilin peptidase [Nocardioidaceae bacterium]